MNPPPLELPIWVSKRPIPPDELAQLRETHAYRLTDEEIQALRADMSTSAEWIRDELRRRQMTHTSLSEEPNGAADTTG